MIDYTKCMECQKYNKDELIDYSCNEYKKIPSEIVKGNKICTKFLKVNVEKPVDNDN